MTHVTELLLCSAVLLAVLPLHATQETTPLTKTVTGKYSYPQDMYVITHSVSSLCFCCFLPSNVPIIKASCVLLLLSHVKLLIEMKLTMHILSGMFF